jgi:carboxyl-terminal processing protease
MVAGCLTGMLATIQAFKKQQSDITEYVGGNTKLNAIWNLVEHNYVDRIDNDSVMDRIYSTMLSTLDPHSCYLSSKDLKTESETLQGHFEGVGLMFQIINDTVCIVQIIPGSPSEKVGLLAADRIVEIDGRNVAGLKISSDSIVSLLRGPRRSTVDVTIKRYGETKPRTVTITRNYIPTNSLTYSGMIDRTTGYIRLERFSETSYDEFCDAVKKLKNKGMKRMVLDLRGNGGGLLYSALNICDELLPRRELIFYDQGAHQRRKETHSTPGGLFCKGELIVMIDEFSASASEIVAGAIQDNDRGIIVGRRSFGKGLVQQQFTLQDRSAVRITTSRYYTPSGRCIQRPYDKGTDEYYSDFIQHIIDEYQGDSLLSNINDSTPYYTAKGRIVYGGGGIYPDHTIHYKTDSNIVYYNQLINKNIIGDYVIDIVTTNIGAIRNKYPTEESFVRSYTVSDAMLDNLFARADKAGIKRDPVCIGRYKKEIRSRLKASIGSMVYSETAFYAIQLPYDPELKEALNVKIKL